MITRAVAQAVPFANQVRTRGATPIFVPTIRVGEPEDPEPLEQAARRADAYDLVVLGSINAANALAASLRRQGLVCQAPIACVGAKTMRALSERKDLRAVLAGELVVPETYRAEALVAEIQVRWAKRGGMRGLRALYPRAPEGREVVQERLTDFGARVDAVEAYRIGAAPRPNPETIAAARRADAVTFLSGETLAKWLEIVPPPDDRGILERAKVAVIGPVAAERARDLGVRVDVVPEAATVESLLDALDAAFE